MEHLSRTVGPLATNVHVLGDPATREAIAIDTAIPRLDYVRGELDERGWTLKLIVSSHGHWDQSATTPRWPPTRAPISPSTPWTASACSIRRRGMAPFEIPPSVAAVDLAEGGTIRFGELRLGRAPHPRPHGGVGMPPRPR